MDGSPVTLQGADEQLLKFRDWYRNLIKKLLIFQSPVIVVLVVFLREQVDFKLWGVMWALLAGLFFSPISSTTALTLIGIAYLVLIPLTMLTLPGIAAVAIFQPAILPVYAASFGGRHLAAAHGLVLSVTFAVFTYLHAKDVLVAVPVNPFALPLFQWFTSLLVHALMYV